jgi:hypothetical protein
MTSQRYRDILAQFGMNMTSLGRYLGVNNTVSRRWGYHDGDVPENVAAWLEWHAAHWDAVEQFSLFPFPEGWRVTSDL